MLRRATSSSRRLVRRGSPPHPSLRISKGKARLSLISRINAARTKRNRGLLAGTGARRTGSGRTQSRPAVSRMLSRTTECRQSLKALVFWRNGQFNSRDSIATLLDQLPSNSRDVSPMLLGQNCERWTSITLRRAIPIRLIMQWRLRRFRQKRQAMRWELRRVPLPLSRWC